MQFPAGHNLVPTIKTACTISRKPDIDAAIVLGV